MPAPREMFVWTARVWGVVFLLVGATFAVRPVAVGEDLTALARVLRLGGVVESGPRDLWWVLALSMMLTITVLALWCANEPDNAAPFVGLMTSKLTSTFCFLVLSLAVGPAWLLCALGDGFVALTLWWSRRRYLMAPRSAGAKLAPT